MFNKKKIIIFIFLTLFFTLVFFLLDTFFYTNKIIKQKNEESHIEKTLSEKQKYFEIAKEIIAKNKKEKKVFINKEEKKDLEKNKKKLEEFLLRKNKINFLFIPEKFFEEKNIKQVLLNKKFNKFIENIKIIFIKDRPDVRWKMKDKSIFLFAPDKMEKEELLAVFIHEFSHYIDLYYFPRDIYWDDISNKFYDISWKTINIIKSWQKWWDFVSWYAMTNKYEDFAESLTYYILHNKDFLKKSQKSFSLRKKYNFFAFYVFPKGFFRNTNFSTDWKIRDYYRDITKIKFSLKKFLQYLKK